MEFKTLSLDDCLMVRKWRNETLYALRTPYGLTAEQQTDFYVNVVCDRKANARYWGIWTKGIEHVGNCGVTHETDILIGMAGLENIEWENRRAEISLIIDWRQRSMGNGNTAFEILLEKGFHELNLENIWGVCYECNPALGFWRRQINKYKSTYTTFPNMKFWSGNYWAGLYFNFERSNYVTNNP